MNTNSNMQSMTLTFDRNKGFQGTETVQSLAVDRAAELITNYASKTEKDYRFRIVTNKIVVRVLLILAIIVFILLVIIANFWSAIICFFMLFAVGYYVGYVHARMLRKLKEEFNLQIGGTDWEYFGCHIENKFGKYSWKYYCYLPFIKPQITLDVRFKPKANVLSELAQKAADQSNALEANNVAIGRKGTNKDKEVGVINKPNNGGMRVTIPLADKILKAEIGRDRPEQQSIEIGNHEEKRSDQEVQRDIEREKLFS